MMDELNWPEITKRVNVLYPDADGRATLALYIHLTGQANTMHLMYAGFEPNWTTKTLQQWRSEFFLVGSQLTELALLKRYPLLQEVLLEITAGKFDQMKPAKTVIETNHPITTTEKEEVDDMPRSKPTDGVCLQTANCMRGANHIGRCYVRKTKPVKNGNGNSHKPAKAAIIAHAPEVVTTAPASPAVKPKCRFKIEFEEVLADGEVDQIAIAGNSRAYFERIIRGLNSLIG